LIKPISGSLKERHLAVKDAQVLSEISKAKAKEEGPDQMLARAEAMGSRGEILTVIGHVSSGHLVC
jgi:hypothetical protein